MPELPEVETIRRGLEPELPGRVIVESRHTTNPKFTAAGDADGSEFESVRRRGKYLLLGLDDDRELVVHLGMTGVLSFDEREQPTPHERAAWLLDDGRWFVFDDVRQFGRIAVVDRGDHRSMPTLHRLGPEPWDAELTDERFWRTLRDSNQRVKTQLLSQRPIAGVGNIYADEACWLARVHPGSRRVSRPQAARLLEALRDVLRASIDNGGTTLRDYRTVEGRQGSNQRALRCYGLAGEPCERCATPLSSRVYDGRTTTWCRTCQRH